MSSDEALPFEPTDAAPEQVAPEEFDVRFLHESWRRHHEAYGAYLAREATAYRLFEDIASAVCERNATQPEVFPMRVNPNGGGFYTVRYRPIDYDPEPGNTDERRFIVLGGIHTLDSRGAHIGVIPRLQVYTASEIEEGADPSVDILRHDLLALRNGVTADGANLYQLFISGDTANVQRRMDDQFAYVTWLQIAAEITEVPLFVHSFTPQAFAPEQNN